MDITHAIEDRTDLTNVLKTSSPSWDGGYVICGMTGSGETFACGTGTCATVVAAVLNGFCKKEEEILVHLRGGDLRIIYHEDDTVTMIGPATYVFEGKMEYPNL